MLDNFRSQYITWDTANKNFHETIELSSSDEQGRKIVVQIIDNGQVVDLTGVGLNLYWETKDKHYNGLDNFDAVDIKKGVYEIYPTTGMLSNVGELNAWLYLVTMDGEAITSVKLPIRIEGGINAESVESEDSFSALTDALSRVVGIKTDGDAFRKNKKEVDRARGHYDSLGKRLNESDKTQNNIREDLSGVDARVNDIITTDSDTISNEEIIDARQGHVSLGDNIRSIEREVKYGPKTYLYEDGVADGDLVGGFENDFTATDTDFSFVEKDDKLELSLVYNYESGVGQGNLATTKKIDFSDAVAVFIDWGIIKDGHARLSLSLPDKRGRVYNYYSDHVILRASDNKSQRTTSKIDVRNLKGERYIQIGLHSTNRTADLTGEIYKIYVVKDYSRLLDSILISENEEWSR